ncbi:MAG: hypothetical protein Q8O00_04880, partial [Holophaga sp.]|nr:hypothetical protein [Holophaga sp.]
MAGFSLLGLKHSFLESVPRPRNAAQVIALPSPQHPTVFEQVEVLSVEANVPIQAFLVHCADEFDRITLP